jgi:hydroxycarboxylate dehydrogenase B
MPSIGAETLERITREIFVAWDVPKDDAVWVARQLVLANLRGHDSHGVIRIPQYVNGLKTGYINPAPHIATVIEAPTIAVLDGDRGLGQVVARRGIELAIDKAKKQGLSAVGLRGTTHVGRLADYAETAAKEGLVGMLWVNAVGGLNVAPWGGAARRLGTNPHAIAIPGPGGTVAMSLDFATSVWAEGKLRVKFNRGETVPAGIMLDGVGEPSNDPRRFYTEPPGSLLTAGEHKGYGLSLAVEILAGILSGTGAAGPDPTPFRNGTLMICLDVARFLPLADFHRQVAAHFDFVKATPLAAGAKEIVIPGEPEERLARERRANGIPVEDETWRQIQACASERGVRTAV